jgi:hypothetical protein
MRKNALFTLAYAAVIGAAGPIAAGAGGTWDTAAAQQPAQQSYSDARLQAYVAASRDIDPISSRVAQMTAEQRADATRRIQQILRRHNLTGDVYNGIRTQVNADAALAQRIAALQVQNPTDDLLQRFAAAAGEIDPISRSLTAEASEQERAQAGAQIRAVLDRYNLHAATYNALAARAQSDQAFADRIAQLRAPQPAPSDG